MSNWPDTTWNIVFLSLMALLIAIKLLAEIKKRWF